MVELSFNLQGARLGVRSASKSAANVMQLLQYAWKKSSLSIRERKDIKKSSNP